MSPPISLATARQARADRARAALARTRASLPPDEILEAECGRLEAGFAQAWQAYFDALGLTSVRARQLSGEAFRELLVACLPMAVAALRWMARTSPQAPATPLESYLQSVCEACPQQDLIPSRLARAVQALHEPTPEGSSDTAQPPVASMRLPVRRLQLVHG